jgi:N-methylhydantoinase B
MTATTLDPITLEVVASALGSTADEMALVVMRSAYSAVVRDSMDYSTSLCDRNGQIVAQGLTLAGQLGTFPSIMRHIVERAADTHDGDVFIANDPFDAGGQHLPDIYIISPICHEGEIEGYAATMAHHSDVGGLTAGSVALHASEIYQEGLRLPILKLIEGHVANDAILKIIAHNTRSPLEVLGDLRAQLAACRIGQAGLRRLIDKYGAPLVQCYLDGLQSLGEAMMGDVIATLPNGRYRYTDYVDGYGDAPEPLAIEAVVEISDRTIEIDFPSAPRQVPASLNCPVGMVFAACYCAIRQIAEVELPNCEGYMRPIAIHAPEGSILNPVLPASCGARGVVGYRVYDAVMGALAQAVPDRVRAPGEGGPTLISFGGYLSGRPYVLTEVLVGNWGARPGQDGPEGISNPLANLSNQPAELIEADFPLEVLRYGLAEDTGGPGEFRGGLAFVRDYRVRADGMRMTIRTDRRQHPPPGLDGGQPGAPSTVVINPGAAGEQTLPTMPMGSIELDDGDVIHHVSAGGGGVGSPHRRSAELVLADVVEGKVSRRAARESYRVAIVDESLDLVETARLRGSASSAPASASAGRAISG